MRNTLGRILVTGASGQLGSYLLHELRANDLSATAWSRRPNVELFGYRCQSVDLCEVDQVVAAFRSAQPDVVIHTAAMSGVADCFRDPTQARRTNATATRLLAELTDRQPARFIYVSTDLVFDGKKQWYRETDCPAPLSVYGQTKAGAERTVLEHPHHLVLRISLLFGPSINGRPSFFQQQIQSLRDGTPCRLFEDEWRTPLSLRVAAKGLLAAATSDVSGILHLGGRDRLSRLEMGQRLCRLLGKDERLCQSTCRDDATTGEPRPRDTSFNCDLWDRIMDDFERPGYEDSLRDLPLD